MDPDPYEEELEQRTSTVVLDMTLKKCPALKQLDDPRTLEHLRAAYTFLDSARLHYCENCDEEWVVFDEDLWPQGGAECAGPKAGMCETIVRTGYKASQNCHDRCSRCDYNSAYSAMFSKENLQHLGEEHEALSRLTFYESLLVARVHPVISVVTLTATGQLCYTGNVCNYYQKVLEWHNSLPAVLRDKKWFFVKRRKSINAVSRESHQKKPTTANRLRLMAAFRTLKETMPKIYDDSQIVLAELDKFPVEGELEMDEIDTAPDLRGEVKVDRKMFAAWLECGKNDSCHYPCAAVIMQYAIRQQKEEMTIAEIIEDSAWELCSRELPNRESAVALGTGELAALVIYWLDEKYVAEEMRPGVYQGMVEDLEVRGKTVQTDSDHEVMKSRWVKQKIHGELDLTREEYFKNESDVLVDLDVEYEMVQAEQPSISIETEQAAKKLITQLTAEIEEKKDESNAIEQVNDPAVAGLCACSKVKKEAAARDHSIDHTARKIGEDVLAWQALHGCQRIPNRRSQDEDEKKLGKRFEDVLRRRYCAIGDRPCQQKLSANVMHFINRIPGVSIHGCSVKIPEAEEQGADDSMDIQPLESIPLELVEDRGDGWYKWRSYWKWAPSKEEGHLLLNAAWRETQEYCAIVRKQAMRRKRELQKLQATDDKFSRLRPVVLKRDTSSALTGRYTEDNNKVTFVEDGTNHRVTLEMPSDKKKIKTGWFKSFLDMQVYNAVIAEHKKATIIAKKKVKEKEREQRMPTTASEMAARKRDKDGMWIYTYETTEVEVTPRALRPPLQEDATKWKQERHREPTRDRALRKMKEKIKRRCRKAVQGELERISQEAEMVPSE